MSESDPRRIDIESRLHTMGPPTDDDVPMTLDWEPLNTKEKLLTYLAKINDARERARAT